MIMSTHNLCFGAKIRKIGIPLHTPVLLYKVGFKGYSHVFLMYFCSVQTRVDHVVLLVYVLEVTFEHSSPVRKNTEFVIFEH